ncbi:hypothetical protein [Mycobacterium tuberculosis]|uniref:hypothetical protein n=1 Tax=Mycobacterium tuberculosis TaxID=1773 RepID=UPI00272ADCC4|nr:hypothetical protein [Mycobacterium tuberculosis]
MGGYDEEFMCQDGYELWIKFSTRYKVQNVPTPLYITTPGPLQGTISLGLFRDLERANAQKADLARRIENASKQVFENPRNTLVCLLWAPYCKVNPRVFKRLC